MQQLVEDCRFLGVDETRHGRPDELFVGVYSDNPFLVMPDRMGKRRNENTPVEDELKSEDAFRYVRFNGDFRDCFSDNDLKVIAISELIRAASPLERVIFDGHLPDVYALSLSGLFGKGMFPRFESYHHADVTYPIVNKADRIASILGKNYDRKKRAGDYSKFELYPSIDFYLKALGNCRPIRRK